MKISFLLKFSLLWIFLNLLFTSGVSAWSGHQMMVYPALKDHIAWGKAASVEAKNLRTFLVETEKELVLFLAEQESWSRKNLPHYAACPDTLAFKATGNKEDILIRFLSAIRINPDSKIPLYLSLIPGKEENSRMKISPTDLTTLKEVGFMEKITYVSLQEGELASPFQVLYTASDEPDYGFDLGLFTDNGTPYGRTYGFGNQPFGNPNLEYSSQAPFHMGFFHEAGILYTFGAFLKNTHLDYRIFLYKALSEFAFHHHQPYWGWRFMGWGMHYVGDVSMPYHMKPLPGVSNTRMIWMSLKSMMGSPRAQDNAVQLVSNRHTAFEEFQSQVLLKALQQDDTPHPFLQALKNPEATMPFSYSFLLDYATAESASRAKSADKILEKNIPEKMVSDPSVEANNLPGVKDMVQYIMEEKGEKAVDNLTGMIAGQMRQFSMNVRSYMEAILASSDN